MVEALEFCTAFAERSSVDGLLLLVTINSQSLVG